MSSDERTEAYPVELILPNGHAQLVAGSVADGHPRYVLDGVPVDVDVEVPEDLAENWFWWGSQLYRRTPPGECGISIATGTYPPPGVPAERGSCFDTARKVDATHAWRAATSLAETKKPAKKQRRAVPAAPVALEPEQMVMDL